MIDQLAAARNVLVFGVGGGNDSVTALLLTAQLARDHSFRPERVTIAAMLPDVLRYTELVVVDGVVHEITPRTRRWVGAKELTAFPEPILATHGHAFGVNRVLGLAMSEGSDGLLSDLPRFLAREGYDLVLACDVGGDFIATPENLDVLSPMMDGYALSALRRMRAASVSPPFVYCVFGLGTDGESSPEQLRVALARVGPHHAGRFDPAVIAPVERFYREVVEPNRHSRTADFTLRSIHGQAIPPTMFRARFHTRPEPGRGRRYYGEFTHHFDLEFAGRYYLFDDLAGVRNPFERACRSGLEWFLGVQGAGPALNHELNGQSYPHLEELLGLPDPAPRSLYFGTPSRRFTGEPRREILADIARSIAARVFDSALVYRADLPLADWTVDVSPVSDALALVTPPGLTARLKPAMDRLVERVRMV